MLNTDAALQDLAVVTNGTTIVWQRAAASPELDGVSFELSTDGTNYTALAAPTRVTNAWQLTGLTLPQGQDLFIRARGIYSSGYEDGSGSVAESVVNAFVAPPFLRFVSITPLTNGHVLLNCLGVPYSTNAIEASSTLAPGSFAVVTDIIADPSGAFQYEDTTTANLTQRFYRLRYP